ncbi:PREDICTED: uncharacterized protein DDB_G0286299-like [Camelina sativa]|uniref:Uncharacterized protein DDB_G0286299-like n=1 Tax=Camelina sativa TaxID=90675 RepID=A0ABM0YYE8_CAMSA|nr:PREDICTED: uncharacterized protein DDB_G0286299-like [Camelina sativa]
MSRRESRDSDPKRRQRSRIDREPSPKRSRRDGKPEAERVLSNKDLDVRDGTDTEQKPRPSLRDAAPLEPDALGLRKDSEKKHSAYHETTKQASHLSQVSLPRSYHQHDDDPRSDRKDDRRATTERGSWRSSRDQRRAGDDEKSQHCKDGDKSSWRHDRFHESDDTQGALARKRPAFMEKKLPEESGNNTDRTRTEARDTNLNHRRQNERNWRSNMHSERHERPAMGRDRVWNRDDVRGAGSRQSYRGDRDNRFRSNERSGFNGSWTKNEKKWDHDLFEEANKSPTRATEEEQIAKVESLLAS